MKKLSFLLLIFTAWTFQACDDPAGIKIPERGVSSSAPADRWDYGFLTGNGNIGTIVFGQPQEETIIFNHGRLYLPHPRPPLVDLGPSMPEIRRLIRTKGYDAAQDFAMQESNKQGHFNYHSDPFHWAFELKLRMPAKGTLRNYIRTTDFETGEVAVGWEDDDGAYIRKLFVSRPDNVAVLYIKGPGRKKLNLAVIPTEIKHEYITSALSVEKEWISYHNAYKKSEGGYDNVVKVIAEGGTTELDGNKIVISGADEIILLTGIEWHEKITDGSAGVLKDKLSALPADYRILLKKHVAEHSDIFNRVKLDLGGGEDLLLTSEELLDRAKSFGYKQIPPALIQKMYDASRFYFICSAGNFPPNLQGIWNGEFTAPWNGSYTFDANVQNAMDAALSANMMEGMEGYFRLIESFLPEWRINAQKLFGARGIQGQIVASPNTGLLYHYERSWTWNFWTPGAGWLVSYFYDYYRFTGDKDFLKNRVVPIMKDIALFYEDFLTEKNADGHYIYRLSVSPEVRSEKVQSLLMSDNSTLDIAVAKELFTNLISACEELDIEKENIAKWRTMLANMPPYQVGPDGDLAEWADGSFRHAYDHRHHSPFYPLFRSFEFSPENTPELWEASKKALAKKGDQWLRNPASDWSGIPFGRAFHAQAAAYLGWGNVVEEIVDGYADRVYPSLHMSLRPDGHIFNFDGNGAYPDIINRSLAFSLNGTLDLLRSVPPGWNEGSISGILVRGQIRIDNLRWNQKEGTVILEMTSSINQQINLRLPASKQINSLKIIEGTVAVESSGKGENVRKITLPGEKKVRLELHYDPERKAI